MNTFKKTIAGALIASAALITVPAHALIIQDGWDLSDGTTTYTNIGHLSLSGGFAFVDQQVNGSGNPYVGSAFSEAGGIFSTSKITENLQGFNDFATLASPPVNLNPNLTVEFVGLAGTITSFNNLTGAIEYMFTAGAGDIFLRRADTNALLAELDVSSPSGGDLNDFFGTAQTAGQSTILMNFVQFFNGFDLVLNDPYGTGTPTTYSDPSDLFLQVQTNNKIGSPASEVGACSFDANLNCRTLLVTSDGSADLLKVPEPGSLALLGIGLLGFAGARRRSSK